MAASSPGSRFVSMKVRASLHRWVKARAAERGVAIYVLLEQWLEKLHGRRWDAPTSDEARCTACGKLRGPMRDVEVYHPTMHESLMSIEEIDQLHADVMAFFVAHRGDEVSTTHAEHHFEGLGYKLTRPIFHTLQAHGVVAYTDAEAKGYKRRYDEQPRAWKVVGETLRPSS